MKKYAHYVAGLLFVLLTTYTGMRAGVIPAVIPGVVPSSNRTAAPASLGTARFALTDASENLKVNGSVTSGNAGSTIGALDLTDPVNGGTLTATWAGSASNFTQNFPLVNNLTLTGYTSAPTSGNCAQWALASGQIILGQASGACGSGSGGGGGFAAWSSAIANTALTGTTFVAAAGGATVNGTEGNVQTALPYSATGNDFYVQFSSAPGAGNTLTFTMRLDGVDTAVTCALSGAGSGAGFTTCNDTTHTFSGTAGHLVDTKIVCTGTCTSVSLPTVIANITWNYGGSSTPSAMTLLYTASASSSSVLTAATRNAPGQSGNLFQSDFQSYQVIGSAFVPSSSGSQLQVQMSHDAGSTWLTTNYSWSYFFSGSGTGSGAVNNNSDSSLSMGNANSTTAGASISYNLMIYQPLAGGFCQATWDTIQVNSGDNNLYRYTGGGAQKTSTSVNAIRTQFSAGNIATGGLQVYGLSK